MFNYCKLSEKLETAAILVCAFDVEANLAMQSSHHGKAFRGKESHHHDKERNTLREWIVDTMFGITQD